MRRYPKALVDFIQYSMTNHTTTLRFDDFTSEPISIDCGIGQGDPHSMSYYIVYNTGLIEVAKGNKECTVAFVDDIVFLAIGADFAETHSTLHDMMTRQHGALQWADKHNSRFEFSKLALIDFTRSQHKKLTSAPLQLPNALIHPLPSTRYLGVIFNPH